MRRIDHNHAGLQLVSAAALFFACAAASSCSFYPFGRSAGHPAAAVETKIEDYPLALVVRKSSRTLDVYRFGSMVDEYPIVLGARPEGDKMFEGDMRTPEGFYRIVRKRPHSRWRYFLDLDYPNTDDRLRYDRNVRDGRVPVLRNKPLRIGNGIGIHGTDHPFEQKQRIDWTRGCIAMTNDDVKSLYRLVEVGTPVFVLP